MAIYLIRHPRPRVEEGLCYGRTELELAEPPHTLLPALRAQLPPAFRLYSSPARRCAQLAAALGGVLAYDERLLEMDFGSWELRPWQELGAPVLDAWIASGYEAVHGGESLNAFAARVRACLDERAGDDESVLVCHAGVIRVALALARGLPADALLQQPLPFASVHRIDWPATRQEAR